MTDQELQELQERQQADLDIQPNQGFSRDSTQRVQKALTVSATGLAETVLSDVNKWREVMMANPTTLPFKLPPSLQGDIDRLNNTVAFTGLKVPSLDILETDLKKTLGGLAQPTLVGLNTQLNVILGQAKGQLDKIKQLDWLL